jgi:FecR protein
MMRQIARKAIWCGIFLSIFTFTMGVAGGPARADDQPGVARISITHGNVDVKRGDSGDTVAAAVNAPVMVGDYVSTDNGARAEIQLDNYDFVRVGNDTQLRFTKLDPNDNSLQLAQGTVELRVLDAGNANPSVETPTVTVRPDQPGQYRIRVTADGDTQVTVRSGEAEIADSQGSQTLTPGNTMLVTGDASNPSYQYVSTVADNDFDQWTDGLDSRLADSQVPSYVNNGMVGADGLDSYGHWVNDPNYGQVWSPNEGAGWVPYRDGQWVFEPYYGWTWVSDEPWGWAPYHYGNWFYAANNGWCWYPGPVFEQPIYRPAEVAFFGYGNGNFSLSVGFGFGDGDDIGWFPVGPFEPFYPWWGGGNNVVVVNNITNIYNVYPGFRRGAVVVRARNFENGNFSQHVTIPARGFTNVRLVRGVVPIVPSKNNLGFGGNPRPVAPVIARGFGGLRAPAPVASFRDERSRVQIATRQAVAPTGGKNNAPFAPLQNRPIEGRPIQGQPIQGQPAKGQPIAPVTRNEATRVQTSPWARFGMNVAPSNRVDVRPVVSNPPAVRGNATVNGTRPVSNDPWSRFGMTSPKGGAVAQPVRAPVTQRNFSQPVNLRSNAAFNAPVRQQTPKQNASDVWSRFGASSPRGGAVTQPVRAPVTQRNFSQPVNPRSNAAFNAPVRQQTPKQNASDVWSRFGSAPAAARPTTSRGYQSGGGATYSQPQYQPQPRYQSQPVSPRANYAPARPVTRSYQMPSGNAWNRFGSAPAARYQYRPAPQTRYSMPNAAARPVYTNQSRGAAPPPARPKGNNKPPKP